MKVNYNNSWALVIGINSYEHEKIPDLWFAEDDAESVASMLPGLGFPHENIRLLLGCKDDITRECIMDVMESEFNPKMEEGDRFLFYFAGHGVCYKANRQERGFILMKNSELHGRWPNRSEPYLKKVPGKSLEMGIFLEMVRALPAKHKLLLLDSCFSGFMIRTRGLAAGPSIDINKRLKQWMSEPVTQVLTAGRSGQLSYEKEGYGHGIFTWYIMKGLEGFADTRSDGIISFMDLATYVRDRVAQEIAVEQDPQFGTYDGEGQFFFVYEKEGDKNKALLLPDFDPIFGRSLSPVLDAIPSPYGTQGNVRRYEKGSIYFIAKAGTPELEGVELKENTSFKVDDSVMGLRYESLGGSRSRLGFPVGERSETPVRMGNAGAVQEFEGGGLYYREYIGVYTLFAGKIMDVFVASEREFEKKTEEKRTGGQLGFPVSDQTRAISINGTEGYVQRFENGLVVAWSGRGFPILKDFYELYRSIGECNSDLGFPKSDIISFSSTVSGKVGSIQYFENGCVIFHEMSNSCKFIVGNIFMAWKKDKEKYGFPLTNPYHLESGFEQLFEGGRIGMNEDLYTFTSPLPTAKGIEKREPDGHVKGSYKVAFRDHDGKYVGAAGGGGGLLMAISNSIKEWETFQVFELAGGKVNLRANNGQYISAEGGGGGKLRANGSFPGVFETFELIDLGNHKVALQSHDGHFVSTQSGEGRELVADRTIMRDREVFVLVKLSHPANGG